MNERMPAKKVYEELNAYFHPQDYDDPAQNGLLADFAEEIEKVYTATFAGSEVLDQLKAREAADCLIFTHHPRSQRGDGREPRSFSEEELTYMKKNRISHFSLHLPLDQTGPYSPGVSLARAVGATPYNVFYEENGATMGLFCTGPWRTVQEVKKTAESALGHPCSLYQFGEEALEDGKIAIMAGGAGETDIFPLLRRKGIRLFFTGVTSPSVDWFTASHEAARAQGISLMGGTHYSTEKFAPMAMCRYFEERGLLAEFIEETPVFSEL